MKDSGELQVPAALPREKDWTTGDVISIPALGVVEKIKISFCCRISLSRGYNISSVMEN
jgi:hypothetical protein